MNHEEQDALWNLLGKAKPVEVSPFFSRNVLRAIRAEHPEKSRPFSFLFRRWTLLAAGACAVAIAGLTLFPTAQKPDSVLLLAQEVSASPDYQVITNLDELLDSEASSVWLDTSVY